MKKRNKKTLFGRKRNLFRKGTAGGGTIYVIAILTLVSAFSFMMIGGNIPLSQAPRTGQAVKIITPNPETAKNNLQLLTFQGITLTPTPIPKAGSTDSCQTSQFNTESEILVGSDPAPGGTVAATGSIKVWVNDEGAPFVGPGAVVDPATGNVSNPGDTAAVDTDTDGEGNYLWTPALYVVSAGQSLNANGAYCDAKTTGCTPHFPNIIKGNFNNSPASDRGMGGMGGMGGGGGGRRSPGVQGPAIDSYSSFLNGPDYSAGTQLSEEYTAEYIWNVSDLGLNAGNHTVQFVIHDGDRNMAIDCLNIKI